MKELPDKENPAFNLSTEEVEKLSYNLKNNKLSESDVKALAEVLKIFLTLRKIISNKRSKLAKFILRLFGDKTEKDPDKGRGDRNRSKPESKGRTGRNGRNDYPGAKKEKIQHETLKPGDFCPECLTGKLKDEEPNVDYDWQGQSPIGLTIYLLQRLLCQSCKISFVAKSPVKNSSTIVDDSSDSYKTGRCDRNATANAMVASLRFEYGIPHYRLAKIQGRRGIALPVGSQDKMIKQVLYSSLPVYKELMKVASGGDLYLIDDTRMKILDLLKKPEPPEKGKRQRTSTRTSIIISKVEGKSIVIHFTGHALAGENLSKILKNRCKTLDPPKVMSDALAGNNPDKEIEFIKGLCLDHGRRQFFELKTVFPDQAGYVLEKIALIYKNDSHTKEENLSDTERQEYHKEKSTPVLIDLGEWMKSSLQSGKIEENSELGKACFYWLKHWQGLTEFLHTQGMPLSNAETERTVKNSITHRKNSLFYKTKTGALAGDVIQSIIETCNKLNINSNDYLVALQINRSKVTENPSEWLPWNYKK